MEGYSVVPATAALAAEVIKNARQADRDELWAGARMTLEQAIPATIAASRDATVGLADERPVCLYGVMVWSPLSLMGAPWLIATGELGRHVRPFLECSRYQIGKWRQEFKLLENRVDARNTRAVRWLSWLGFTIDPAQPFGPERLPFHRYHWEAD